MLSIMQIARLKSQQIFIKQMETFNLHQPQKKLGRQPKKATTEETVRHRTVKDLDDPKKIKQREYQRKWYIKNRQRLAEKRKNIDKQYFRDYNKSHKKEKSAYNKKYREEHHEYILARNKRYRDDNKERDSINRKLRYINDAEYREKRRKSSRRYYEEHCEELKSKMKKRYWEKKNAR